MTRCTGWSKSYVDLSVGSFPKKCSKTSPFRLTVPHQRHTHPPLPPAANGRTPGDATLRPSPSSGPIMLQKSSCVINEFLHRPCNCQPVLLRKPHTGEERVCPVSSVLVEKTWDYGSKGIFHCDSVFTIQRTV